MSDFLAKGVKKIPTLSGIKFTDEDVAGEGKKCLQVADGTLTIFNGFDEKLQEALCVGFDSAICGSFSGFPSLAAQIFTLMREGQSEEAKRVQQTLTKHMGVIAKQTGGFNIAGLKAATSMLMGIDLGPSRLPVKPLTSSKKEELRNDLKNLGCKVF
ncbi:hypothetical protein SK128_003803 [Halocaridina rubra]|uniref:N-acetylneuraminate lyase n=1 Tax=Halocaridina rubra TaxID=373956 RepID=A0AAN8X9C9_HALRR